MIAKVREFEFEKVEQQVNKLIETSQLDKPFTTVTLMKNIVPEFISKNSIYEQLDAQ